MLATFFPCRKTFHLPCGIENGSLQQFFGNFLSFCPLHRPVQTPSIARVGGGGGECGMCLDELEEVPGSEVLWTPCCGGWFHRDCVERMAETAGCHYFKCPLCNNKKEFSQEMQDFGGRKVGYCFYCLLFGVVQVFIFLTKMLGGRLAQHMMTS